MLRLTLLSVLPVVVVLQPQGSRVASEGQVTLEFPDILQLDNQVFDPTLIQQRGSKHEMDQDNSSIIHGPNS